MDINVFQQGQFPIVFRALRTALAPEGALAPEERSFLRTYAEITGYSLPSTDPEPIAARDVLRSFPPGAALAGAHERKRLVQLAAMAAMLHRPVRASAAAYVEALSEQLDTPEPVVAVLRALSLGRKVRARLLTTRRGLSAILGEARRAEGVRGVLRFLGALFFQLRVNRDGVFRYRRLGLLPEGTLGREVWAHLTELGYSFPGEPGGIPATMVYHDIGHVLAGNDTTPAGEILQGSFQGGNRRQDGFFFVQFVLLQFHQGVQVTPIAAPEVGYFDPEKVLRSIHRGAACGVDITHQWDFWPLMSLPLEEARARVGLSPKAA